MRLSIRGDDDANRQAELARKLEVALVMCGNGHHRTRAVVTQDEIRDPHRHRLTRERIDGANARIETVLFDLSTDARGTILRAKRLDFLAKRARIGGTLRELGHERMFGAEQHERRSENRVDPRGKDLDARVRIAIDREADAGA